MFTFGAMNVKLISNYMILYKRKKGKSAYPLFIDLVFDFLQAKGVIKDNKEKK